MSYLSSEYLRELTQLPLNLKEDMSAQRIRELCREVGNEFYVSFSGGKDSEVAVDFTAKTLKALGYELMHVMQICTGMEYLSVTGFCKPFCEYVEQKHGIKVVLDVTYPQDTFAQVITKYGYPVISKEVSQVISEARKYLKSGGRTYRSSYEKACGIARTKEGKISPYNISAYRFLLDAPFRISNLCCHKTKKAPAERYKKATGYIPLVATMTEESRLRKSAWLKRGCNSFEGKHPRSAPFSFWTTQDILQYIYVNDMPVAKAYGEVVREKNGMDRQMDLYELFGLPDEMPCRYHTTGCQRTGCLYCLFGITQDPERILRLQELEPKRTRFVLEGGTFDEEGMWIPTKQGLGYAYLLDYLNDHGIYIPYKKVVTA